MLHENSGNDQKEYQFKRAEPLAIKLYWCAKQVGSITEFCVLQNIDLLAVPQEMAYLACFIKWRAWLASQ